MHLFTNMLYCFYEVLLEYKNKTSIVIKLLNINDISII